MKLFYIMVTFTLFLTSIFSFTSCSSSNDNDSYKLGQVTDYRFNRVQQLVKNGPAPDFQMRMPDDELKFLSDLRGQVVLLNFWAVSCPYCVYEMPYLQTAYEELSTQGVMIIGVNVGEPEQTVEQFIEEKGITFTIVLDPDYYASILYNARYLPVTYIIDKAGNIQNVKYGAFSSSGEIIRVLEPLI